MEMWIKNDEEALKLPVLPSSFEMSCVRNNEVITINSLGEINLLGKRGLQSISISSLFPKQQYYFAEKIEFAPYEYVKKIKKWLDDGDIVIFLITDTKINLTCVIESFVYGENDASGDVSYTIEFKEYRYIKKTVAAKEKNVSKTSKKVKAVETKRSTKKVKTITYVIKEGDTLQKIAKKKTGSSSNWRAIYNQNKKVIGNDPNKIKAGRKLVIKI